MFGKNRKKKVGICVMVVTSCFILAALWAVLATPETALAHKTGEKHNHSGDDGGGGGGDTVPTCVQFDVGSVMGDLGNTIYCDDKKAKVSVSITSNTGNFSLATSSSNKVGAGRGLVVDFGTLVTLAPGTINEMTVSSTTQALADPRVLFVDGRVSVGAFQESVDFNTMQPDETNELANLGIRITFHFTDGSGATGNDGLLIRLAPNVVGNDRHCPSSDSVTVTYLGTPDPDGLRKWRVETQPVVVHGAGISRTGEGEFLDTNLLTDVNDDDPDLEPGHIALSFGFTVTAAP